jgi:hypothetical protein
MSLRSEFLPLFENAAHLRKRLAWGRESSRQVQDLKIYCVIRVNILVNAKLLFHTRRLQIEEA